MDATGHNFILCVKGTDGWCEKAPIAPKGAVFLPSISIASEGIQYLTLLHHHIKQVAIFWAAKGGYSPRPFPLYTSGLSLQAQRIYSSLHKLLYQLRNYNSCQTPQKLKTSAPSQQVLKWGRGERKRVILKQVLGGGNSRSKQSPASEKLGNILCSRNHSLHRAGAELLGSLNVAGESPHRFSLRTICN